MEVKKLVVVALVIEALVEKRLVVVALAARKFRKDEEVAVIESKVGVEVKE